MASALSNGRRQGTSSEKLFDAATSRHPVVAERAARPETASAYTSIWKTTGVRLRPSRCALAAT